MSYKIMKLKLFLITISFIFFSECSVKKTYFKTGEIKTKNYKIFKSKIAKTYNNKGKLITKEKLKQANFERVNIYNKTVNEQINQNDIKGFYRTGFRNKKYKYNEIITFEGFVYKVEFTEFSCKGNELVKIKYGYNNREINPNFTVSIKGIEKIKFNQDTIFQYMEKIITSTK